MTSWRMEQVLVLSQIVTPERQIMIVIFMQVMVIHHNLLLLLVKVMVVLWYFYELCYIYRFHFGWNVNPVMDAKEKINNS